MTYYNKIEYVPLNPINCCRSLRMSVCCFLRPNTVCVLEFEALGSSAAILPLREYDNKTYSPIPGSNNLRFFHETSRHGDNDLPANPGYPNSD
ncbi:hypothetical protein GOBAR_AA13003 [Gossypium barbadense]|uniref:Uncharacterized protein n=1 Tax=Gossypium barbadense TaxID=3634 RepID=A0A2P5XWB0_GOSBA|nr:hypothetical protein GOBAR_AA13003 [Gossypium barbadense]